MTTLLQIIVGICAFVVLFPLAILLFLVHIAPLGHEGENGFVYDHRE